VCDTVIHNMSDTNVYRDGQLLQKIENKYILSVTVEMPLCMDYAHFST